MSGKWLAGIHHRSSPPAACHPSDKAANGDHTLFTDFSDDAFKVPSLRNAALPGGRHGTPALSDAEIDDVVAFLGTLSDGWTAPR